MRGAIVDSVGLPPRSGEAPDPTPEPGEALIEVVAAPVRPIDYRIAGGALEGGPPFTPYVAGGEGVGRILEASGFSKGSLVWFQLAGRSGGIGAIAEKVAVPETDLVRVPPGTDPLLASAFGGAGTLAGLALEWRAELRPGESVLMLDMPGVLGQVGVQAAGILGAGRVVVASRHEGIRSFAAEIGADAVVELPTGSPAEIARRIAEETGASFDIVLDGAWGDSAAAAVTLLGVGGRLVTVWADERTAEVPSLPLRARNLSILGISNIATPRDLRATTFTKLLSAATAARIRIAYDVVELDQITQAWHRGPLGRPFVISLLPFSSKTQPVGSE
jgi:NADPH:quinone reductase-like Zn-dependent oxidoreductase